MDWINKPDWGDFVRFHDFGKVFYGCYLFHGVVFGRKDQKYFWKLSLTLSILTNFNYVACLINLNLNCFIFSIFSLINEFKFYY